MKKNRPYKQGIVATDSHPDLLKGQVIEIIEDCGDQYKVRVFINGKIETIDKKLVIVN